MFKEKIGNEFIVIQEGTSEGTQIKYRKDGFWYKKDNRGHEGRAEYLVSKFMEFTSLKTSEYVTYEEGTINGSILQRSRKRSFKSNRKYGYDGRKDRICGVIYKRKL